MRFSFFFLIVFISCSTNENANEVKIEVSPEVSFEEKDSVLSEVSISVDPQLGFLEKSEAIIKSIHLQFDTLSLKKSILLDRFGYLDRKSISFKLQKNTELNAHLFFYNYTDSSTFQNAISNWYGCFGDNCVAITENQKVKLKNTTPSFTIINEKKWEIVHFIYDCNEESGLSSALVQQLKSNFPAKSRTIINLDCKGSLMFK